MKTLVITVAGTATRFNKDTERTTLKCLYYIEKPQYSLLYQILDKARDMDEFIIVGGYLYEELSMFISKHLSEFLPKIKLVYNSHYMDYGSGYSLIKGIKACLLRAICFLINVVLNVLSIVPKILWLLIMN